MIIPMKKYAMLLHHKEFHTFLKDLQEKGMVDMLDRGREPDEKTSLKIQTVLQLNQVIKYLQTKARKDTPETTALLPDQIMDTILQSQASLDVLNLKITLLEKQVKMFKPWGNFSSDTIDKLKKNKLYLKFFTVSQKRFKEEWLSEYHLELISQAEGQSYFVIVLRENESIAIDAEEVKTPEKPAIEVQKEIDATKAKIETTNTFIQKNATAWLPPLIRAYTDSINSISLDSAINNAQTHADDRLKIIEGWVPESETKNLNEFLDSKGIFYLADNPVKNEKVPILLRNGKFSKLFEPIGKLYSLPKYGEFDLIPFFAPFFMLFFGFCLGDAGYGLFFVIGATLLKPKMKPEMKKILSLLQWLGGSTVVFGIVTGTFFGMNLIELVDNGKINWLLNLRKYMLDSSKMFYFALILGAIQIIYGMFIKAANLARQHGFKYALSTIGWIILILGNIGLYFIGKGISKEAQTLLYSVLFVASGVLILLMNNPDKNIFVNFGGGLWDVYAVVTGVMGDLLSYIRLFALGVSSAILGYVFNDLALQMSGSIPVVSQLVFLLILIIGHGLNIFMATLGAFVHPMRLTFVEFYKNAGFQGGGKPYNPFRRKEA